MTRTVFLGVALAFGLATAAGAAVTPAQVGNANSLVIKAEKAAGRDFGAVRAAGAIRCSTAEPVRRDIISARKAKSAGLIRNARGRLGWRPRPLS